MKAAMHPRTPSNHAVDTTQKPWLAAGANDTAIISTSKSSALATHLRDTTDPLKNGWPTEAFSDAAAAQLVQLATLLSHPKSITTDQATRIVSPDFTCTSLRPASLEEVFRDSAIVVRRASDSNSTSAGSPDKATNGVTHYVGPAGLVQALPSLVQPFREANPVRVKLKIVGIAMQPTLATTTALFELSATFQGRTVQQNAVWQCRWRLIPNEAPQLLSIIAEDYEESVVRSPQSTLFADCTLAVLGHNRSFREQLLLGLPHWLPRIELRHAMNTFARYGGAVGDVNGDGLEDLYVCQPGGLPNRLFIQNHDGTAADGSQEAGVDILDCSTSALFVDLDNDGDQDLVVAIWYELLVFENDAAGRFKLRAKLPTVHRDVQSLSASDFDNDGRADLYITVDMVTDEARADERRGRFLYHDSNDGAPNLLYRNLITGSDSFVDVTGKVGLDVHNRRHSLAAAWEDYDNDGDQDLYVANDFGKNCLYRNDHGRFVEIADEAGVVDHGSGMSVSWGDYDRDGHMDLYVGNMFSSAGARITTQPAFKVGADEPTKKLYRRMAKGNSLFRNLGGNTFQEVGAAAAVEMGRWAWSSLFADVNNDGWEDLLVANGYLTTDDTGDL
jgi:hypothetical protein